MSLNPIYRPQEVARLLDGLYKQSPEKCIQKLQEMKANGVPEKALIIVMQKMHSKVIAEYVRREYIHPLLKETGRNNDQEQLKRIIDLLCPVLGEDKTKKVLDTALNNVLKDRSLLKWLNEKELKKCCGEIRAAVDTLFKKVSTVPYHEADTALFGNNSVNLQIEYKAGKYYAGGTAEKLGIPCDSLEEAATLEKILNEDPGKINFGISENGKSFCITIIGQDTKILITKKDFATFKRLMLEAWEKKYGKNSMEYQVIALLDADVKKDHISFTIGGGQVKAHSLAEVKENFRQFYVGVRYGKGDHPYGNALDLVGRFAEKKDQQRVLLAMCDLFMNKDIVPEGEEPGVYSFTKIFYWLGMFGGVEHLPDNSGITAAVKKKDPAAFDKAIDTLRYNVTMALKYSAGAPGDVMKYFHELIAVFQKLGVDIKPLLAYAIVETENSWGTMENKVILAALKKELGLPPAEEFSWSKVKDILWENFTGAFTYTGQTDEFKTEYLSIKMLHGKRTTMTVFDAYASKFFLDCDLLLMDKPKFLQDLMTQKDKLDISELTKAGVDTSNYESLVVQPFYYISPKGEKIGILLIGGKDSSGGYTFVNANSGRKFTGRTPEEALYTGKSSFYNRSFLEPGGQLGYKASGSYAVVSHPVEYPDHDIGLGTINGQTIDKTKRILEAGGIILGVVAAGLTTYASGGTAAPAWVSFAASIASSVSAASFLTGSGIELAQVVEKMTAGEKGHGEELAMSILMSTLFFLGTARSVRVIEAKAPQLYASLVKAEQLLNVTVLADMGITSADALLSKDPAKLAGMIQNLMILIAFHASSKAGSSFSVKARTAIYKKGAGIDACFKKSAKERPKEYCARIEKMLKNDPALVARLEAEVVGGAKIRVSVKKVAENGDVPNGTEDFLPQDGGAVEKYTVNMTEKQLLSLLERAKKEGPLSGQEKEIIEAYEKSRQKDSRTVLLGKDFVSTSLKGTHMHAAVLSKEFVAELEKSDGLLTAAQVKKLQISEQDIMIAKANGGTIDIGFRTHDGTHIITLKVEQISASGKIACRMLRMVRAGNSMRVAEQKLFRSAEEGPFELFSDMPENIYGGFYQLVRKNSLGSQSLFDAKGMFRTELFEKYSVEELCSMFRKAMDETEYFKMNPYAKEAKNYILQNDVLPRIIELLRSEPEAFSQKGRAAFKLREKMIEDVDSLPGVTAENRTAVIREIELKLTPNNMKELANGEVNIVYELTLTTIDRSFLVAIRRPLEANSGQKRINASPLDYATQFKTQQQIYGAMEKARQEHPEKNYARIPQPYFLDVTSDTIVMELIKPSYRLADLGVNVPDDVYRALKPQIYERLKNTLDHWETGNDGNVLFRHHDLHAGNILITLNPDMTLKDIYIIDFDFSRYCPGPEESHYIIKKESNMGVKKETFPDDREVLGKIK